MCRGPAWPEPTATQAPGDRSRGRAARSTFIRGGDFVDAAACKAAKPPQVMRLNERTARAQSSSATTGASFPTLAEMPPFDAPPPPPESADVPPLDLPLPLPPPPAPVPPL